MGSALSIGGDSRDFCEKYIVGRRISQGTFGSVHVAFRQNQGSGPTYCVRLGEPEELEDEQDGTQCGAHRQQTEDEEAIWRIVGKHENILTLLEVFRGKSGQVTHLVTERYKVLSMVHLRANFRCAAQQMLRGIAHLHQAGIVHRDIRLASFAHGVVERDVIKLGNFASAAVLPDLGSVVGWAGEPEYMSPEMLHFGRCREKTDLWSFGVLAHLALSHHLPDSPSGSIGERPGVAQGIQWLVHGAEEFVGSLLRSEQEARPSAEEALELPLLTSPLDPSPVEPVWTSSPTGASLSMRQFLSLCEKEGAHKPGVLAADFFSSDTETSHGTTECTEEEAAETWPSSPFCSSMSQEEEEEEGDQSPSRTA